MADPTYPLFPFFSFLGFVLALIPLPWHLHAWNSGTCYFMMWTSLACLNQFVNSVVWHNNALNPSPGWCEISIRIMMGSSVGIPLASLCINKRLYQIASSQAVTITHREKRRAILIDTILCVFCPLLFIAIQYVIQGHRFNIYEDIGCYPSLYNTLLAYFISTMWPVVIGLISAVYCFLSLRTFARRRLEFSQFISSNRTSLTMGRYFRLMGLAAIDILLTTPLALFSMYVNASAGPLEPWRSWSDTHFNYSRIEQVPRFYWSKNRNAVLGFEFTRTVPILCAVVFFGFFGFADEAKKNYRRVFWAVARVFGYEKPAPVLPNSKASIGPYSKSLSKPPLPSSPVSSSSISTASTGLPPYSGPPPSFYAMDDMKKKPLPPSPSSPSASTSPFSSSFSESGVTSFTRASTIAEEECDAESTVVGRHSTVTAKADSDAESQRGSVVHQNESRRDAESHRDDASTASILEHDAEHRKNRPASKRFSWKSILLPTSERRYSSYV